MDGSASIERSFFFQLGEEFIHTLCRFGLPCQVDEIQQLFDTDEYSEKGKPITLDFFMTCER